MANTPLLRISTFPRDSSLPVPSTLTVFVSAVVVVAKDGVMLATREVIWASDVVLSKDGTPPLLRPDHRRMRSAKIVPPFTSILLVGVLMARAITVPTPNPPAKAEVELLMEASPSALTSTAPASFTRVLPLAVVTAALARLFTSDRAPTTPAMAVASRMAVSTANTSLKADTVSSPGVVASPVARTVALLPI